MSSPRSHGGLEEEVIDANLRDLGLVIVGFGTDCELGGEELSCNLQRWRMRMPSGVCSRTTFYRSA